MNKTVSPTRGVRNIKILYKLVLVIVVVAIIVGVGTSSFLLGEEKKIISSNTRWQVQQMAGYAYGAIDVYFYAAKNTVEVLAQDQEIVAALRDETIESLEKASLKMTGIEKSSLVIDNASIHNAKGIALAAGDNAKTIVGMNFSHRMYHKQVIASKQTVVSEAIISSVSKKPVVIVAAPAYNKKELIGYAVGAIELTDLKNRLSAIEGEGAHVILLDSQGNKFLDTRKQEISIINATLETDKISFLVQQELEKNASGFLEITDEKGEAFHVSFKKLDYATIIVISSQAPLNKLIEELSAIVLIGGITAAFLAVIAIVFTIKRLTNQIDSITKTIESISKGMLNTRIDPELLKRDDEIGDLARAFDRTIVSLKLAMKNKPKPEEKLP